MSNDIRSPRIHPTKIGHFKGCYLADKHLGRCQVPVAFSHKPTCMEPNGHEGDCKVAVAVDFGMPEGDRTAILRTDEVGTVSWVDAIKVGEYPERCTHDPKHESVWKCDKYTTQDGRI